MGTGPAFEGNGYGRVVLTATDSTQYAWEGNQVIGESDKSVFTHYLLQGLRTGDADRDGDGLITIDELYDYVYENVVSETPRQTPGKWTYKQQGEIVVARSSKPVAKAVALPPELLALIESPLVRLRIEAIPELANLLAGRRPDLVTAALHALEGLLTDDSRKVAAAAEEVLSKIRERRQKIEALLAQAEQAASHEAAIEALNEVLVVDPGHETARHLLAHRRAAFEQEVAERARRQQIEAARDRIGELLQRDELSLAEEALAAAEKEGHEVAAFDELRHRLRQKQLDRLASEAVERAGAEFAAGRHDSAVTALERFRPPHPAVTRALTGLKAEIERARRHEEEQRRLEAMRVAREQEIASGLDAARTHIRRRQFVEAKGVLHRVKQLDPEAAGLAELAREAEAGRVAVEEAERRRHECQSRLAAAQKRFDRRDFAGALALTEDALRVDPQNPEAVDLRAEIQRAMDEQTIVVGSAESTPRISQGWFHSKPLRLGLVAVFMVAAFVVYRVLTPVSEPSQAVLEPVRSAQDGPPAPAVPPSPSDTGAQQPPSTIAGVPDRTPPVVLSSASGTVPSSAAGQREQRVKPREGANDRRVRDTPVENPLDVAQPGPSASDVAALTARLLEQGDKLLEARNYDGAVLAYEDASRHGSTEGRPRAEKARQQKALEIRSRVGRAERLQDTGDYEGALRAIDEAVALDPKSTAIRDLRQRVLDAQGFERGLRPKKFE